MNLSLSRNTLSSALLWTFNFNRKPATGRYSQKMLAESPGYLHLSSRWMFLHPLLSSLGNVGGFLYSIQAWSSRPAYNQPGYIRQPDLQERGPSRLLHIWPYGNQKKFEMIFFDLRTRDVQLYFCLNRSSKLVIMCTPIRWEALGPQMPRFSLLHIVTCELLPVRTPPQKSRQCALGFDNISLVDLDSCYPTVIPFSKCKYTFFFYIVAKLINS